MSDGCNKLKKLSTQKLLYRRCHSVISHSNMTSSKNQMASSMQQFCIDSNIMLNGVRKCSQTGNQKQKKNETFVNVNIHLL